ncbi:MAG: InlB B-repeat-containing protein [Treponema sp.]|nr:InlB B-repeat-containing protein [Treponema sp.]
MFRSKVIIILSSIILLTMCSLDGNNIGNNSPVLRFTITFDLNGGSGTPPAERTVPAGTSIALPGGSGFTRSGFVFGGWMTNPSGNNSEYRPDHLYTPRENIALYAFWSSGASYTVTYEPNGGIGNPPPSVTVSAGLSITAPGRGELMNSGFNFIGWSTDPNDTEVEYRPNASIPISRNITLYAIWVLSNTNFSITFNANGGSGTPPVSQTVLAGSSINLPNGNSLTRTGFIFNGWNTNANGTGDHYGVGSYFYPSNNDTLYAQWTEIYTITFNANNGNGTPPITQIIQAGSRMTLPDRGNLSRSGFTFGGWSTSTAGTGSNYQPGDSFTPSGSITLFAIWNANVASHTVTFNANGSSGTPPAAQTVQAGSSIILPGAGSLTRAGFTFSGWNTNAAGTGTNYQPGESFSPSGSITLFARWNPVTADNTVTFNANSGTGTPPTAQTAQAGSSITLPNAGNLSRTGFNFGGWNTNANGTGTNYQPGDSFSPSSNITLFARWITITASLTVTYNANSGVGTPPAAQTIQSGSSITLPNAGSLSRTGFNFSGWNTNAAGTGTNYQPGDSFLPSSSITLFARWNAVTASYTVTFNANGGSGTPPAALNAQAGTNITLPNAGNLTRSGFTFGGWNTNASGTGTNYQVGGSFTPSANITLYARWNVVTVSHTVTFNANGGSGSPPAAQTVQAGSSITLPNAGNLTRSGFTFGGWNTNVSGTGTNYQAGGSFTPSSSITLYARWNAVTVSHTVTYNANGGSGSPPSAQTVQTGSSITLPNAGSLTRGGYTFGGWNTNASGTGTNYQAGASFTPSSNITLFARWTMNSSFNIGDIGPGGGIIFYRSTSGFTLYTSATDNVGITAHYLEAAPTDMSGLLEWSSRNFIATNISNTGTGIGMGRRNTALILTTDSSSPAAKACSDFRGGGLNDWFLPSKDELNQLYINRNLIGNLVTSGLPPRNMYWSSTQGGWPYGGAWYQYFRDGVSGDSMSRSEPISVRAIRAF